MSKELEKLIAETHALQDAAPPIPGGPPRGWVLAVRQALADIRKIRDTPDNELDASGLATKRAEIAEEERLLEKFGPEWDKVFGS